MPSVSPTALGSTLQIKKERAAGLTLVEACVGILIISIIAASIIWGLNQLNYYATVSRLYTAAQTLAQNQIDLILTKSPYDPAQGLYPTPNVLRTDVETYWSDAAGNIYTSSRSVPIYTDPGTGGAIVNGTIETSITSPTFAISGTNLNLKQAVVNVKYTFRKRNYVVTMNTMRAPDQ